VATVYALIVCGIFFVVQEKGDFRKYLYLYSRWQFGIPSYRTLGRGGGGRVSSSFISGGEKKEWERKIK